MNEPTVSAPREPTGQALTPRETEVLDWLMVGLSNKETGRELGISPRTIEVYRIRILDKLGARNAADAARMMTERLVRQETRQLVLALRAIHTSGSEGMHMFDEICRAHNLHPSTWAPPTVPSDD